MLDVKTILYIGLGLALSFILFDPMTVFYMGLGLSLILIITAGVALPFF